MSNIHETDVSAVIVDLERTLRFLMRLRLGEASEASPFHYGRPIVEYSPNRSCYRCNGQGPCRDCR